MVEKSTGGSGLHVDCVAGLVDASSKAEGLVDALAEDGAGELVDAIAVAGAGELVDALAEDGAGQPPVEIIGPVVANKNMISRLYCIGVVLIFEVSALKSPNWPFQLFHKA